MNVLAVLRRPVDDDWTFQPEGRHPSQRRHGGGRRGSGEKDQVANTTHVAKVALDVRTAGAEHQNKRKGICSFLYWRYTKRCGPYQHFLQAVDNAAIASAMAG